MGKVEKIVVLGVLFVIVLILVVSLDTGPGDPDEVLAAGGGPKGAPPASRTLDRGGEPVREVPVVHEEGGAAPDPIDEPDPVDPAPAGGDEGLLVAVQLRSPVYEVPDAIPEDWALTTLAGLADHYFDPTHKVYQARQGDTFEDLAERFYGDAGFARLLRRSNEGRTAIAEGDQLLVPTHDDGLGAAPSIPADARTYVALEGESLWKIAKKVYGKGHLWERIWDANQDRLDSPDDVPTGVELIIP